MIFDIFLIGFGIAGKLHKKVYSNEKHYINKISLFDPYITIEEKGEINFVDRIDLINSNNNDTILDICTNSDRHVEWIEFALDKGFKYAVIEKPLVTSYIDLTRIESRLNGETEFYTVNYNYLCSPVLASIENIIDSQQLKVVKIRTNFSKNRINDSKTKRGADKNGDLLHNFLIEIPHQLSIALKLLGQVRDIDLCYAKDMIVENQVYKNHGEGFIKVIHNNGIASEHFSNLSNAHTIREIIIEFEDDHILTGYFGIHPEYNGKVELKRNGKIIITDIIVDKSIDSFLSKVFLFFDNKIDNPCDIKFAIDINKVILECIDMTNLKIKINEK
jgi:predicted dehydrogenase